MAKKIDPSKRYTVFDRVRFEMLDWTGYNAELLDELIETGNALIEENETLKRKYTQSIDWDAIRGACAMGIMFLLLGSLFIFALGALIKTDVIDERMSIAYKAGQVDVLMAENIQYEQTPKGFVLNKNVTNRLYQLTYNGKQYSFFYED